MYVALDKRAFRLVQLFGVEATQAWAIEKQEISLITLAASQVLCIACHTTGRDALGQELIAFGRSAATSLGLIGIPNDGQLRTRFVEQPPEWRRAASHIAWGTYCWLS